SQRCGRCSPTRRAPSRPLSRRTLPSARFPACPTPPCVQPGSRKISPASPSSRRCCSPAAATMSTHGISERVTRCCCGGTPTDPCTSSSRLTRTLATCRYSRWCSARPRDSADATVAPPRALRARGNPHRRPRLSPVRELDPRWRERTRLRAESHGLDLRQRHRARGWLCARHFILLARPHLALARRCRRAPHRVLLATPARHVSRRRDCRLPRIRTHLAPRLQRPPAAH